MVTDRLEQQSPVHTCAYSTDCAACKLPSFDTVYEVIDGNDLTPHYGKRRTARTVSEAVANGLGPADYIVAVVNGSMRELTAEEQAELHSCKAHYLRRRSK